MWWKTDDLTDLDYTPLPLIRRANAEDDRQFTRGASRRVGQERVARALRVRSTLRWQAGLFLFSQNYTQDAVNTFSPFVLSQFVPFAVDQHSPQAALDDHGVGVYGRGTLTFSKKLDAAIGLRADHENKAANLNTFFSPAIAPPTTVDAERSFNDVSPQFTVSYHVKPDNTVYATAARGFKAGGFNAASPPGSESYGQEHSWNYEGGVKTSWLGQRLSVNAAVFYIDWTDLQVNVPNPLVPAQFYVANAGTATSKGFEVELNARPQPGLDVFASVGHTSGHFGSASTSGGVNVSGNTLANMPDMTGNVGVQYSRRVCAAAQRLRTRRGRHLRQVLLRRCEYGQPERVLAREFPCRRARARGCSSKGGCEMPSILTTCRSPSPIRDSRRRGSLARAERREPAAFAPV